MKSFFCKWIADRKIKSAVLNHKLRILSLFDCNLQGFGGGRRGFGWTEFSQYLWVTLIHKMCIPFGFCPWKWYFESNVCQSHAHKYCSEFSSMFRKVTHRNENNLFKEKWNTKNLTLSFELVPIQRICDTIIKDRIDFA